MSSHKALSPFEHGNDQEKAMTSCALKSMLACAVALAAMTGPAHGQTTAGLSTTIVFPVVAQTASFASEITIHNPNDAELVADVAYHEALNSTAPGPKSCTPITVPGHRSIQFQLGAQCSIGGGSHFGMLLVSDTSTAPGTPFYGYSRVQNPQAIGFSLEGFPVQSFTQQVSHVVGLKRQSAAPTYQSNCFVAALDLPVSYQVRLLSDATGAQIGNTVSGNLGAYEVWRFLDIFGPNGVNAGAGDYANVRAEFTQTTGGSASLIGLCTVQDNTSFGADFRIAKSPGPTQAIGNVLWVAKSGGDYTTIQGAIAAAALTASANNPALVRVGPGIWTEQVTLADYVDVEGSGVNVTQIHFAGNGGTVVAGAQAELRKLSVLNTADAVNPGANAIYQSANTAAGSSRLQNVNLVADGATDNLAVYVSGGALTIRGSDIEAALSATQNGLEAAVYTSGTGSVTVSGGKLAAYAGATKFSAFRGAGSLVAIDHAALLGTTSGTPLCFQTFDATTYTAQSCP